jgi:hypothetical protein
MKRTTLRAALDVASRTTVSVFLAPTLAAAAGQYGALEADLGNRRQAQALNADNRRYVAIAVNDLPSNAPARHVLAAFAFSSASAVPLADGDYEGVRRIATEALQNLAHADAPCCPQYGSSKSRESATRSRTRRIGCTTLPRWSAPSRRRGITSGRRRHEPACGAGAIRRRSRRSRA